MARDEGRPLATSLLAVGRFAAKQGSLRSPRGRLVASIFLKWRVTYLIGVYTLLDRASIHT